MPIRIYDINENIDCFEQFLRNQSVFENQENKLEFIQNINKFFLEFSRPSILKTLLIGRIQSGKTLFYTGVIAKYFSKYRGICIVLAGTKKSLKDQTIDRLTKDLNNCNIAICGNKSEFTNDLNESKIFVALKNPSNIKQLVNFLNCYPVKNLLIIDDESDQASLNNENYTNLIEGTLKVTPTFEALVSLIFQEETSVKYVQITATPQAHVLTNLTDLLQPDLVTSIPSHSNYFGNELLFQNQSSIIINTKNENIDLDLLYFFSQYFRNCITIYLDQLNPNNISCFVHVSHLQETNNEVYDKLVYVFQQLQNIINSETRNLDHLPLSCQNNFTYIRKNAELFKIIASTFIIQRVYEKHDKNISWPNFFEHNKYFCLIGGNKLERGFTINGLITTFFTRNSVNLSNADTFEQRCRFFGNRANLINYINVFCTAEITDMMYEYYENEKIIFDALSKNHNFTYEIHKLLPSTNFKLSNPTRKSVISLASHFSKSQTWNYLYFSGVDYYNCMTLFEPLLKDAEIHKDSGNSLMNTHSVIYINAEQFLNCIQSKSNNPKSKDQLKINILKSLTNRMSELEIIALSNLNIRERTFDRLDGKIKIPNAVHSSTNTGGYIGDSNIVSLNGTISIQIGNYKDKDLQQRIFILAFKINDYDN